MTGTSTSPRTTLGGYDVAQLAGGLPRVVDTAVVSLLAARRLHADADGRLHATGTAVHPVEAAVLELVGPRPRGGVLSLRIRAQDEPRLTAVAAGLVAAGLLRNNPLAGLSSRWPAHLLTPAGRRALEQWRAAPTAAGDVVDVALGGAKRMADQRLWQTVFGPTVPPVGRRSRWGSASGAGAGSGYVGWTYGGGGGFDGGGGGCGDGGGGGGGC